MAAGLDVVAVDAGGAAGDEAALAGLLAAVEVDVLDVEGMDVARDDAEDGQADVDEEVCGRRG